MKKLSAVILLIMCAVLCTACFSKDKNEGSQSAGSGGYVVYENEETGLFGYKDADGNVVIECKFERANPFFEGRAAVKLNRRFGYIDEDGNPVTPFIFTSAGNFSSSRAVVTDEDSKCGYIDTDGKLVIECKYTSATNFDLDGIATVVYEGRELNIDINGNEVIEK